MRSARRCHKEYSHDSSNSCSSLAAHRTAWAGRRFERSFSIRRHIAMTANSRCALWFVDQLDFLASAKTGDIAQQLLESLLHCRRSFTRNQCGDTIPATIGACESDGEPDESASTPKVARLGVGGEQSKGSSPRIAAARASRLSLPLTFAELRQRVLEHTVLAQRPGAVARVDGRVEGSVTRR